MTGRYGNMDYPYLAKTGFLVGVAMFVLGGGGELVGHSLYQSLPAWEDTLFFGLEAGGLLVLFLAPLVFGIILPLTE